mmetsp:Transcript_76908/g.213705  ORF Transcript_76908/g.213705 Transcript_76908/m.213705 type:complete len:374 (+) Transcript_76908:328-1449(+)
MEARGEWRDRAEHDINVHGSAAAEDAKRGRLALRLSCYHCICIDENLLAANSDGNHAFVGYGQTVYMSDDVPDVHLVVELAERRHISDKDALGVTHLQERSHAVALEAACEEAHFADPGPSASIAELLEKHFCDRRRDDVANVLLVWESRRCDADHVAVFVEGRPSRISRVYRRIDLDQDDAARTVLGVGIHAQQPRVNVNLSVDARDDALRDANCSAASREADCFDLGIEHRELRGERGMWQVHPKVIVVHGEDGEVQVVRDASSKRPVLMRIVLLRHLQDCRVLNDVGVRHNAALWQHEACARPFFLGLHKPRPHVRRSDPGPMDLDDYVGRQRRRLELRIHDGQRPADDMGARPLAHAEGDGIRRKDALV